MQESTDHTTLKTIILLNRTFFRNRTLRCPWRSSVRRWLPRLRSRLPDGVSSSEGCQMDGLDEAVTLIPKGPALSLAVALCSVPRLSAPALSLHRARCARFHEGMSVRAHRRFVRHDLPQGHDFYMEMTLSSAAKLMHWQVHALRCAARRRGHLGPFLRL